MADRRAWVLSGVAVLFAPASSWAQDAPRGTTVVDREVPQTPSDATSEGAPDPAQRTRAERITLATLASIGTMGVIAAVGVPTAIVVGNAASRTGPAGLTVALSLTGALGLGLGPLAYSAMAAACEGRGAYWGALVGFVGGGALGLLPLVFLGTPGSNAGPIIAASVLGPVLALAGQSLGYELSMSPWRAQSPPPSARRRRPATLAWAPSASVTAEGFSLSIGGAL